MASEEVPPISTTRARREVKAVEKLTIEQKEDVEFVVEKGDGTPLGEIENVEFKISRFAAQSDELKTLHRVCFGKPGAKLTVKKNLRKFSGFIGDAKKKEADIKKKAEQLKKVDGKIIKKVLEVCDLQISGTKAESIDRLLAFLSKPESSGKKSLVEKIGEKRKAAERKKSTVARKKAKKGPGKVEKVKRPKTAYQLYADSRREKVKAENPDASFGELQKILAEKWKAISEERRAKYMEQAAELKKEFDAKQGKGKAKASPSKKAKKADESAPEEEEEVEEEEEGEGEEEGEQEGDEDGDEEGEAGNDEQDRDDKEGEDAKANEEGDDE